MNNQIKNITIYAMFASLLAILAQIVIPLPGLVPISLQTLGIYIIGCVQKPKQAFISALLYLLVGAIGVPVFASFGGGLGTLLGATGGYIFSFPLVTLIISLIVHLKDNDMFKVVALVIGTIVCYSIGTIWFIYITNSTLISALTWCVFPFLIGDTLKMGATMMVSKKIYKYIN
jgi:biotin transport system substrate-specific component